MLKWRTTKNLAKNGSRSIHLEMESNLLAASIMATYYSFLLKNQRCFFNILMVGNGL